ncbi:uncharacterized protein LOC115059095 isoform X3 [Echeneis naucrates]|uniref:uncharacterized protein LOC115059095 isoform X3 n=1 Tax=Echeneis naucrates TaxID=173247 RepID=UPI00111414E2|nr:uncharacterized protein LOC115059095 isoform X3 [Echeneis naucrates]
MDTALTALLCICSWISASVSEFHTVEVQPGEEVILLCNNFTKTPAFITWFKMDSRPGATCIASLWNYDANVSLYVGFPKGEFNMTSNMTTIFLHIKHVNFSDSGLHFCGSTWANKTEMVSATYLKVQADDREQNLQWTEKLHFDDWRASAKGTRSQNKWRELETRVIYVAR